MMLLGTDYDENDNYLYLVLHFSSFSHFFSYRKCISPQGTQRCTSASMCSNPYPRIRKGLYYIATDKALFFIRKMLISFLFLDENICCGCSLEAPRRGASNEYPQHMFSSSLRKILCGYPLLSVAMVLSMEFYYTNSEKRFTLNGNSWLNIGAHSYL